MQTRHNCTACRLAKCFSMGMSSDLIRKEDHKKSKNSSKETSNDKKQATPQQLTVRIKTTIFLKFI